MKKLTTKQIAILGWTLFLISTLFIGFFFFKESIDIYEDYNVKMNKVAKSIISGLDINEELIYIEIDSLKVINGSSEISDFVTDDLKNSIINNSTRINIIDKSAMANLLNWKKIEINGLTDPLSNIRLGKLRSPKYVIKGQIFIEEKIIEIDLKLIEIESGLLKKSSSQTLPKRKFIDDIQNRLIESNNQLVLKPQKAEDKKSNFFVDFFIENWTWIWTVIVIPIIGVVLRRLNLNPDWIKKQKTSSNE